MHAQAHRSSPPRRFLGDIKTLIGEALRQAEFHPHRRSEILGHVALGLAARAQHPKHRHEALFLRQLAEQIAEAALTPLPAPEAPATIDDFLELLEERAEGHAEHAGDIDTIASAEQLHNERVAQHGPRVSIAPLSWGKGATLGRSGTFKFNPTTTESNEGIKQSATLAFWQGEPHEAQAITVDMALSVDFTPTLLQGSGGDVPPQTSTRGYGLVSYGSDGAITQVKFDAGFGTRLTVTGSYVAVVGGMDPPLGSTLAGTLSYTASIGAFASPSTAPVFLTQYIDQLAEGQTTAVFPRPQHATAILPILSSAIGGNAVLQFFGQDGVATLFRIQYPIGQLLNPIPLPSEVQFVSLRNETGDVANFRVPFQLSL